MKLLSSQPVAQFRVRAASPKDLTWIARAQIVMARETEGMTLHLPTVQRGVKKVLRHPELGQYWLVENSEKQAVGMCLTLYEWSDWRCRQVLWIHSVWVSAQHRRSGVYTQLYAFLKKRVQASPRFSGLRLYVDKRNLSAQKVYRRLGMNNEHYELYEWMKAT